MYLKIYLMLTHHQYPHYLKNQKNLMFLKSQMYPLNQKNHLIETILMYQLYLKLRMNQKKLKFLKKLKPH